MYPVLGEDPGAGHTHPLERRAGLLAASALSPADRPRKLLAPPGLLAWFPSLHRDGKGGERGRGLPPVPWGTELMSASFYLPPSLSASSESRPGESSPWREAKTNVRILTSKFCPLLAASLSKMGETGKMSYSSLPSLGAVVEVGVVSGKTKTRTGKKACRMLFTPRGCPPKNGDHRTGTLQFLKPE